MSEVMMHSGTLVDLSNPDPNTLRVEDLAWHLSREARFANALPWTHTYSVGHHSLVVAYLCYLAMKDSPLETRDGIVRYGLLHDGPEAVLRDLPRGVKQAMRELCDPSPYDVIETRIMVAIANRYMLPLSGKQEAVVKWADAAALAAEVTLLWPAEADKFEGCSDPLPEALDAVRSICPLNELEVQRAFVAVLAASAFGLSEASFPPIGTGHRAKGAGLESLVATANVLLKKVGREPLLPPELE